MHAFKNTADVIGVFAYHAFKVQAFVAAAYFDKAFLIKGIDAFGHSVSPFAPSSSANSIF